MPRSSSSSSQQEQMTTAQLQHAFENAVSPEAEPMIVNVAALRKLCRQGIPDQPYQLRPAVWSLLLGLLPLDKRQWEDKQSASRQAYYDLLECKLEQLEGPITDPPKNTDRLISELSVDVGQIAKRYPILRRRDKRKDPSVAPDEERSGAMTPLPHLDAISCRLEQLATARQPHTPQIILSGTDGAPRAGSVPVDKPSRTHVDALCRLLYASSMSYSPGQADIAATLYLVFLKGSNSHDAEADTFWALQTLLPQFQTTLNDPTALSRRLQWADEHLYDIMQSKDLDPGSPVFAFIWQQALLSATIFIPDILPLWDDLFTSKDKAEALVDMCTALLVVSKDVVFRRPPSVGLWGEEQEIEGSDFVRALTFLRQLPVGSVGGPDAVIQTRHHIHDLRMVTSSPATPISPKASPQPAHPAGDSVTQRISRLVASVTPPRPVMPSPLPRPLMLQDKARRASNPISTPRRDSTSSTRSSHILSPPPRPETPVSRRLDYGQVQMAMFLTGIRRRQLPTRALPALAASCRRYQSNYPKHIPLTAAQNGVLAVGSGVMGVMDTTRGDLVATLSESTASTFLPSLHNAMTSHPEGRQIMRDRPLVSSQTVDLVRLGNLKRGTLGREYAEWLSRGGVTPDTREQVRYVDSPTLAYTMLRYRQTHDLYHTLFSLPPTLPHELTLKVVELSNMSLPVAALSSAFGPFRLTSTRRGTWLQDWAPWALRTGREGRSLVGIYWEKRWEQGVGELRRELGVSRNEGSGVESRWRGYREIREMERSFRKANDWVDEPESW